MTGEELLMLRIEGRCLSCRIKLEPIGDIDIESSVLHQYCTECRKRMKPVAKPGFDHRKERAEGLAILDRLMRS